MALNYVTVTGTFDDGTGSTIPATGQTAYCLFTPSAQVFASGIPLITPAQPIQAPIVNGALKGPSGAALQLLATDNTGLTFGGLTGFFFWTVQVVINGQAQAPWSFFLPHLPATADLSALANTAAGGGVSYPITIANGGTNAITAPAALANLGALPVAGGTMTGWLAPAAVALTFGASIAVNAALGNAFNLTLTASTGTLANPTNPVDGQVIRVRVIQDATGSRTLAYGTAYDFGAAGAPTLSTAASKVDILGFEYVASLAKWCYLGSGLGF